MRLVKKTVRKKDSKMQLVKKTVRKKDSEVVLKKKFGQGQAYVLREWDDKIDGFCFFPAIETTGRLENVKRILPALKNRVKEVESAIAWTEAEIKKLIRVKKKDASAEWYGISYKDDQVKYVARFASKADAVKWLNKEEGDFRVREIMGKSSAIRKAGRYAVENAVSL